ncbi:tRNA (adenosine(37)-N6)-dimethylallyltransferase MiaA [Ruminococcus sp.]|uniref:tRNA (adenosine(37)-N6)-dimethylallyltransferase MiaA n=1 Tax=Ruminococcus sp. TaxID=41978 RepID=UPI0038699725
MKLPIKLISVVGPTASGKTALAVELAKKYNGEIISADSMQIYKGMSIATAKPSDKEKQGIPHHLMDFLPSDKTYSVADFVNDAKACIEDIVSRGKLPIIAGGTGLYVDSLLNGISFEKQERNEDISNELFELYQQKGVDYLLDMLSKFDSESADNLREQRNVKRIIRAIEFYKTSGITISEHNRNSRQNESPYEPINLGLKYEDRQKLYDRINLRVDLMLENGLVEEAKEVLSQSLSSTSKMAIGYKELIPYFNGERSLDECIEILKRETRRYAKRQLTWFNRDKDINWILVDKFNGFDDIFNYAQTIIDKGL